MPQPEGLNATYTKDGTSERTVDTYQLPPSFTLSKRGEPYNHIAEKSTEEVMAENNARFQPDGNPK